MTAALSNWHPGEREVQRKLGYADDVRDRWTAVENAMREQHRIFHTSKLPFLPLTTIDTQGRPWASIVAGATGEIGFVKSPNARTLVLNAKLWDGDPLLDMARAWLMPANGEKVHLERSLTAGLGIEFPTRRRNKFAGRIRGVEGGRDPKCLEYQFDLEVTQALG
jgi:predicted pyridoxine 5'-phosphate oxidase superfamily flavin-nucleotide-binding protein